jgi:predicted GH43/DUF377 family glycosyl hydrolase
MRVLLTVALAFFCAHPALALTRFDFEQAYFSEEGQNVMDHCVVEQDGLYHLFYLRGNPAVNIGHATTTDFIHWTTLPPVVPAGTWDTRVWAPYIFKQNSDWFMYYTGVNGSGAQQSGVAISTDLASWVKLPEPVYHPDPSWAVWDSNTFCHGRDPHVIELDGTYYMLVTAQHSYYKGAVACATSTDLIHWTDAGYIYLHNNWHMLESVFIMQHNGLFHMFFTEEGIYGTSHMSSPTLFGGWDINQRVWIDSGHAPQVTETPTGLIFSRHGVLNDNHGNYRYALRFSPLEWAGDTPYAPKPFPLAATWTTVSGDAFYYQPTFSNNAYVRNEIYPSSFVGDGWINTAELYTGPLGMGSPGMAAGEQRTGVIRSQPFSVTGNSISLLVGGGEYPDTCYVALVDAGTGERLYSETGHNSNVMDRRYWDVSPMLGRSVYIEIGDLATGDFGHICVDDIQESGNRLVYGTGTGATKGNGKKSRGVQRYAYIAQTRLLANAPNPFNPTTTVRFELGGTSLVRIDLYDASGALVQTLVNESREAGTHGIEWNGDDRFGRPVASGVYFARLQVNGTLVDTHKMLLLK